MDKQSRREAVRDYKERQVPEGIFAVRCAVTGETWVSRSRNLERQSNGIWFTLRHGGHPNRQLQAAWSAHGPDAFVFDIVEVLKTDELSAYEALNLLKDRERHWLEALGARKVAG